VRNRLSGSVSEALEISQKLVDIVVWIFQEGARYANRNPMLNAVSDETAMLMVITPAMFALEVFEDILKFPTTSPEDFSGCSEDAGGAKDGTIANSLTGFELGVNSALWDGGVHPYGELETPSVPSLLGFRPEGFEKNDPMQQYLVVTVLEYHLDRLKHVVDQGLAAMPRIDYARDSQGLLPIMVHQFKTRIGALHSDATRLANELKLSELG
jgi:hypothetical protein